MSKKKLALLLALGSMAAGMAPGIIGDGGTGKVANVRPTETQNQQSRRGPLDSAPITVQQYRAGLFGKHNPYMPGGRKKTKSRSFLGSGNKNKKSNQPFHSRMTRRKHAKR